MMFEQLNVIMTLSEYHLHIYSIVVKCIALEYRLIGEKVNIFIQYENRNIQNKKKSIEK